MKNKQGFTLVEVLLVVVIISILAAIVIVAINPARQIAQANNTQRSTDVKTILDAVHQYGIDQRGILPAGITSQQIVVASGTSSDLCDDLVPVYVASMPFDPNLAGSYYTDCTDYNTGYQISSSAGGRVRVVAPGAELGTTIEVTR
jgi:prepilin-type N-terminal cleavage/methylation domain-containing protein